MLFRKRSEGAEWAADVRDGREKCLCWGWEIECDSEERSNTAIVLTHEPVDTTHWAPPSLLIDFLVWTTL